MVEISFPDIPNSPKYPWWQISPVYRSYVEGDPISEFIKDGFRANMASWGLVINSFTGLERVYLDHLVKELGHDRVWAVGPLHPLDENYLSGPTERGGSSSVSAADILSWLDTCDDRKVVYVCFGSQAVLTNKQMEEVASGLEKSGARFIWCVKGATEGHEEGGYSSDPIWVRRSCGWEGTLDKRMGTTSVDTEAPSRGRVFDTLRVELGP
ncbi:hypothetical protein L1049_028127 [Liquidambar formosana]|uniref:Uncharacterized protein n=1 Tax=Liquidambar formosana TaxID=63359 RepID=A0AAP0RKF0_LIQFO